MKQKKEVVLDHISLYDLEGKVSDAKNRLQEQFISQELNHKELFDIQLEVVPNKYEDGYSLAFVGFRFETDEEERDREDTVQKYKEHRWEEYQRLKTEFEKDFGDDNKKS